MDAPLPKVLPKEHDTAAESAAWPGWSPMEAMPWQNHLFVCFGRVGHILQCIAVLGDSCEDHLFVFEPLISDSAR